jgi:hypothetical protein
MEPHKQRLSSMSNPRKTQNPMAAGKKQALLVTFDGERRVLSLHFFLRETGSPAAIL